MSDPTTQGTGAVQNQLPEEVRKHVDALSVRGIAKALVMGASLRCASAMATGVRFRLPIDRAADYLLLLATMITERTLDFAIRSDGQL